MSNRSAFVVAATATVALLLTGCGRQLPMNAAVARANAAHAQTLINGQRTPALSTLMKQAAALIKEKYPNSAMYEVSGVRNTEQMNDAGNFESWTFGALDDAYEATNTVFVTYKGGQFLRPVVRHGFDYGRQLMPLSPRVDLKDAISNLRKAAYNQDFRYVDLFKVINPAYDTPVYVFTGESAVVTVDADSGSVANVTGKNIFGFLHTQGF